jgi:hypothetical protein
VIWREREREKERLRVRWREREVDKGKEINPYESSIHDLSPLSSNFHEWNESHIQISGGREDRSTY